MNKIKTYFTASALLLPALALAQYAPPSTGRGGSSTIRDIGGLLSLVDTIIGWFQAIIFIAAVVLILYAAFTYVTSGGDKGALAKAQGTLIYAAVGIGVALLAYAVEPIVRQLVGAPF